jgi:putative transposase
LNQNELGRSCNPGVEETPMLRIVTDDEGRAELGAALDEIVLDGARRMLAAALEAEVDAYITGLAGERDERGRRLVVRNGRAEPRTITTAAGPIEVTAPRVNDKRVDESGERCRFRSSILTPWARKSPKVSEVLPLMYLHGMSSGDFAPALAEFFGSSAGLSASVITRLTNPVAGRATRLRRARSVGPGLRVRVGRRRALQRPPRGGPAVLPGHRRCAH